MNLHPIFEGPTILAEMLREELRARGIAAVLRATEPYLGIIGEAAQAPFSVLLIDAAELERRPEQIRECLSMVTPLDGGEADEA